MRLIPKVVDMGPFHGSKSARPGPEALSNSGLSVKHYPNPLSVAGNTVVSEVVTGGLAGALHDSALWLWPPRVSGAIAEGCPPCTQRRGIDAAAVPAGTRFPLSARNRRRLLLVRLRRRVVFLFRPAEQLVGDQHPVQGESGPSRQWRGVSRSNRQLARQRHAGLLVAAPSPDSARPVLTRDGPCAPP